MTNPSPFFSNLPFIDLQAQRGRLETDINTRIQDVLAHGQFVMGPEMHEFEEKLAEFGQAKYALGCANGTDAIILSLLALGVGAGDAVFCPSFTYCATAEAIILIGATPVFVDIDRQSYNMNPQSLKQAIVEIGNRDGLTPKAILAVDLFGQAADYPAIASIATAENLPIIADSAQGFGCRIGSDQPLRWASLTTTSFFPAKPLGCYGDGGAVLTNDEALANEIISLRNHGMGADKYDNVRIGLNSRLDTLQAAIMLPKLAIFQEEIERRMAIAARYTRHLENHVARVPHLPSESISSWAQYTIEVEDWAGLAQALRDQGIPTARYYPKPVHLQTAYQGYPIAGNHLTNTEICMDTVISLPMHPYLDTDTQDRIIEVIADFAQRTAHQRKTCPSPPCTSSR